MFDFKYIAIYPKIMSWRSSLIKENEIEEALKMNLKELSELVKSKLKKATLKSENITDIERAIKQDGFLFLKSVERFVYGSSKKFFKIWVKMYEIENIKLTLKILLLGKKEYFNLLFELEPNNKFQYEFLNNINTIEEFLEFLSGTEYYSLAQNTFPRVLETKTTFFFDIAIDNYLLSELKRFYDSLSILEKGSVKNLLFYFLESKRIISLYRAKFLFNLGRNECMVLLPELLGIFTEQKYEELLATASPDEFIKLLIKWNFIKGEILEKDFEDYLEFYFFKELLKRAKSEMKKASFSISFFLSFFMLHYLNEKNWVALLQAKSEEIEIEDTMKFLVF